HKIDQSWRLPSLEWGHRLSPGETLFYVAAAMAGLVAAVLLARALGPRAGDVLARVLGARFAPHVLALLAVAATLTFSSTWLRTHSYPEESGCEFAARALLRGRLTMPSPPDARELDYPFVDDAGGHRFGVCGPAQTVLV